MDLEACIHMTDKEMLCMFSRFSSSIGSLAWQPVQRFPYGDVVSHAIGFTIQYIGITNYESVVKASSAHLEDFLSV